MRQIKASVISDLISRLCIEANINLRPDIRKAIKAALKKEKTTRAKEALRLLLENADIASDDKIAICQDTGMAVVFVEIGQEVKIVGDLKRAINKGVELGYRRGFLRNSIVKDPLLRGKSAYQPAIIHIDIVKGNKLKITVLPKGFGCENKTQLKIFRPTAEIEEIKKFIVETVKSAGPDACPPYVVGVGIGGTADYACLLAKKALLRKVAKSQSHKVTSKLEKDLLKEINKLNIGPMGLGGRTTAMAVNIETYPTHIAGLPVAVNISCHALRSAYGEI